jgi:hypothetical protein
MVSSNREPTMTVRELAAWGDPRPAISQGPREHLSTRLPPDLIQEIRERSRSQGVSVSELVQRLIEAGIEGRKLSAGPSHADLVSTLFD